MCAGGGLQFVKKPSGFSFLRGEDRRRRLPVRLVWNGDERRPRGLIRLLTAFVLFVVLAALGNQYRPTLLAGDGALVESANMLSRQVPNAVGLALAVVIAALLVDRRRLTDLGLRLDRGWWRGLVGGIALGGGITLLGVVAGLLVGYYEFSGVATASGPLTWLLIAGAAACFQLLFVVPEEMFVRGYLVTNVTESFEGVPSVPRGVAAGIGVIAASVVFYLTHAAGKGVVFGLMAGGLSILLGVGYVLSGDLSVPIGIHFGFNFAGVLVGTNAQPASILRTTSSTTVQESIALPPDAVVVRLLGASIGIAAVCWWYHAVYGRIRVAPTVVEPILRWR